MHIIELLYIIRAVCDNSKVFGVEIGVIQIWVLCYLRFLWKQFLGSFGYADDLVVIMNSREELIVW